MHVPQTSLATTITPTSAIDLGLHEFIGVSWHILLPYTLFGAGLMLYSQTRLLRGQKALSKTQHQQKPVVSERKSSHLKYRLFATKTALEQV